MMVGRDDQGKAETERLLLLPWSDDYADEFTRVCLDPEAMRFISGGVPLGHDVIRSITQRSVALWEAYGYVAIQQALMACCDEGAVPYVGDA